MIPSPCLASATTSFMARDSGKRRRTALQAIGSPKLGLGRVRRNEHAKAVGVDWFGRR